jgi:hypothetical protein
MEIYNNKKCKYKHLKHLIMENDFLGNLEANKVRQKLNNCNVSIVPSLSQSNKSYL